MTVGRAPCDLPELNALPMRDELFSHREGLPWQWYGQCHISMCISMARLSQFRSIISPLNQLLHTSHPLGLDPWGEPVVGEESSEGKIPPECPVGEDSSDCF